MIDLVLFLLTPGPHELDTTLEGSIDDVSSTGLSALINTTGLTDGHTDSTPDGRTDSIPCDLGADTAGEDIIQSINLRPRGSYLKCQGLPLKQV